MKSDSLLIKTTACVLAVTLTLSTCLGPVEAVASMIVTADKPIAGFAESVEQSKVNIDMIQANYTIKTNVTNYAGGAVVESNKTKVLTNENKTEKQNTDKLVEGQKKDTKAKTEKKQTVSKYANVGISVADPYVNIRTKASEDSSIVGKLYKGYKATIKSKKNGWAKIKSGKVEGYVKLEYLAIGTKAEKLVDTYATKTAKVKTDTLNLREKKDTKSKILAQLSQGESYKILKEYDKWVNISVGKDKGYVSKDYVTVSTSFKEAISLKEEKAAAEKKAKEIKAAAKKAKKKSSTKKKVAKKSCSSKKGSSSKSDSSETSSGGASDLVRCALRYVGNRYVYGGTSLTGGIDCSGFTQAIYRKFGYSLARSSRDQASSAGDTVSLSSIKKGDLLFYTSSSGSVGHVAIYIGNGKIVHASNPRDGIKVSNYDYKTPCKARRVID